LKNYHINVRAFFRINVMSRLKKDHRDAYRGYALLATLVLAALALPRPALAAPDTWTLTGPMQSIRFGHTATLLAAGQVLVVGGSTTAQSPFNPLATAELYDPVNKSFSLTDHLDSARLGHTATLLPSGKVLVAGGTSDGNNELNSAEVYTPGFFGGFLPAGEYMGGARAYHTATLLPNGKVLLAGGRHGPGVLNHSELYDPATGQFTATAGHMQVARRNHTATLLPSGNVLVIGGKDSSNQDLASAELYHQTSDSWSFIDPPYPVSYHTATLLRTGKVLVLGQYFQLYDPATGTWSTPIQWMFGGTADLLVNGKVLLNVYSTSGIYDPVKNDFSTAGLFNVNRTSPPTVRLADGKVLAMGGRGLAAVLASAELYDPEPPPRVNLPSLLGFYPFEGNANDLSGHALHGTMTGSPVLTPHGYEGQAYSFDGTAGGITVTLDISPVNYPRLTMGCWVRTRASWPPNQAVLNHDNGGFDRYLGIDCRGGGIGWSAFCGTGQVLGAVPPVLNAWTFLAVSYDQPAQTVRFQVDDMVFTRAGATLDQQGLADLVIGASPPFSIYFNGVIDNVFIYGDVLTDQQLAYIRSGGARAILSSVRKIPPALPLLLLQ
jgi:hypothetical protein